MADVHAVRVAHPERRNTMRLDFDLTRVRESVADSLSVRMRAILALGIVLGLGTVGTMALWSDSVVATSGDFKTGVVDLRVNGSKTYAFTGTTGLTMSNMLPGESRAATLKVQNTLSTLPLAYTVAAGTVAGSSPLTNYLQMSVHASASFTNTTSNGLAVGSCAGAQLGSARLAAAGTVSVVSAAQPLGAGAGTAQSPSTQDLCFVVALVPSAPLSVQSATQPSITLTFSATTI